MAKRRVDLRLDDGLLARLDARAELERSSRTRVIEAALAAFLGGVPDVAASRSTPAPIRGQTTVEEQLRMGHSTGRRPKT